MDRLTGILLGAGLGCFALSFVLSGLYPILITDRHIREATIEEVAAEVTPEFRALKEQHPTTFAQAFPDAKDALTAEELSRIPAGDPRRAASEAAWRGAHARALRRGRDLYVAEACWHCHSQFVRPVANEEQRFGPVQKTGHDNNALQRPVLWGTRRVGPDLTHEGGLRSNDWHFAHLHDPKSTTPGSVMPRFRWYFQDGWQVRRTVNPETASREGLPEDRSYAIPGLYATRPEAESALERIRAGLPSALEEEGERLIVAEGTGPTGDGLSLVAYLQWLGTWTPPHLKEQKP
jgi:cbb3-type cytochrome c oxidase subunit II